MSIAILILAAGSSTRMGVAKQLLPAGKTTLLGVTIENALNCKANAVYCILGANEKEIEASISKYNVETIFNPNYKTGLSSSIVAGIEYISGKDYDAVLILLGDQPYITTENLNKMVEASNNHKEIIIASAYKSALGVPSIIPKIHFNRLLKLKGDKGAKDFLNNKKDEIIQLKRTNLIDIDTQKEYQDYLNSTNFE